MVIGTVFSKNRRAEILLVEDNIADILLTEKAFGSASIPCRVTVAENAEEAMALLRREATDATPRFDLILLDLNLPKKNGVEVLHEIKEDKKLLHIPVIVLTMSRADKDIQECRELHANCYVVKPLDFAKFKSLVESIVQFWLVYAISPYE